MPSAAFTWPNLYSLDLSVVQCCCQDLFLGLETKSTVNTTIRQTIPLVNNPIMINLGLHISTPRPRPGQNDLECTRVLRPWSRDHKTAVVALCLWSIIVSSI